MSNKLYQFEELTRLTTGVKRPMHTIVIHCSATKQWNNVRPETIHQWHVDRGFNMIGYHFLVDVYGVIYECRPITKVGAHVEGHNGGTIGVCYVGGLDENLKPKDTRNKLQRQALKKLLMWLVSAYSINKIKGHRDYPNVKKACPCFDAIPEYISLTPKAKGWITPFEN